MGSPMRIRAKESGGIVTVKVLMKHSMETGQRKDSKGEKIPAHHITDVVAKNNNDEVFKAHFGPAVSKDPYLSFKYKGGSKGDTLSITWTDNKGDSRTDDTKVR